MTSTPATLTWDALNQPATVNSTTATYDALGRMVETGVSGVYTQFVFRPSGDLLAVYKGSLVKGTLPLPGGEAAVYNSTGLNFLRHKDWLGSSRLATTGTHTVYSKVAYAPFGETYNESGSTPDRSFTGQDQNVATGSGGSGVYDYLFRKYDPSAGRWLSPDPYGWGAVDQTDPQSLDRYAYVENQPMAFIDPTGQEWCFAGVSSGGLSVDGGFTCYSDDYGFSVITHPGSGQQLSNGEISTQTGIDSNGNPIYSVSGYYYYSPDMGQFPSSPGSFFNFPNYYGNGNPGTSGSGQAQKQQDCLNKINSTPDGKFYNWGSYLSPLYDTNPVQAGEDKLVEKGEETAAHSFLKATAKNWAATALGSGSGFVNGAWETFDSTVLIPVKMAATTGQLVVQSGCYVSSLIE
ncbi:MAG TPA: RHS repeat-associated core domain-containing protein [Terracidiphilus sp.]|nr:RHS repeat-associated core domain-containing protein [Terracidiphilus sp.]